MSTNGLLLRHFARGLAEAGLHRVNVSLDSLSPERYAYITRGGDVGKVLDGIDAALEAGLAPVKINCVITESPQEQDAREVARYAADRGLQVRFIRQMVTAEGQFWPVIGGHGGKCASCNRLRLSSNGMIRPCLFSDLAFSVRELGPRRAIEWALRSKPESGAVSHNKFYEVGG